MARNARKKSETGVYHLMARGINRQNIFENPEDQEKFLDILGDVKEVSGFRLLGYCLMGNHVHLLVREEAEGIDVVFKRIGARYVTWFNRKYGRVGPLFQGRYQSETVEDDRYLLSVLRYIHQNPVKAGICGRIDEYRWSSYGEYSARGGGITDTDIILRMFAQETSGQWQGFGEFMEAGGEDHMDAFENTDTALKGRMESLCGAATTAGFQALPADERDCNIRKLRAAGFSIRQIVRVTGVPFGVVRGVGR